MDIRERKREEKGEVKIEEPKNPEESSLKKIAIGCQGGGSHTAYTAGVLNHILEQYKNGGSAGIEIIGFSGTSGGALCALLAWYGFLEGGAAGAQEKLRSFWNDNAASSPWEVFYNAMCVWAANLPFEFKTTPYALPLSWMIDMVETWAPRKPWIDLKKLLTDHVNFDHIDKLGKLESLQDRVGGWLRAHAYSSLNLQSAPTPPFPVLSKNEILGIVAEVQSLPLSSRFERELGDVLAVVKKSPGWNPITVQDLHNKLLKMRRKIPTLAIGAADILTGEFRAFNSKKNEMNINHVLASTAIPWIFRAEKDKDSDKVGRYWDGLFSENPPIRLFVAEPDSSESKPDEIWIVQINPQECTEEPKTPDAISERRNQLSGNLSLNQEIASIQAVNHWIISGKILETDGKRYKPVDFYWVPMHAASLEDLGYSIDPSSKLDRSANFLQALTKHGERQASIFLSVRSYIEQCWAYSSGSGSAIPDILLNKLKSEFIDLHWGVDQMTIVPDTSRDDATGTVVLKWASHGAPRSNPNSTVELKGTMVFSISVGIVLQVEHQPADVIDARMLKVSAAAV